MPDSTIERDEWISGWRTWLKGSSDLAVVPQPFNSQLRSDFSAAYMT
jgi:hypothetical protein